MSDGPKILAFAGSLRQQSWNKKLVQIAAAGARTATAEVTYIDLHDFPMPMFNQDIEDATGMDPNGQRFKDLLAAHDGWLIASAEYNSSITAALKNALDWASRRSTATEPALSAFQNKVAVIMSASPGALGGLRSLVHLRAILGNLGVIVLPEQKAVPNAAQAFAADGTLRDAALQQTIEQLGTRLVTVCQRLSV